VCGVLNTDRARLTAAARELLLADLSAQQETPKPLNGSGPATTATGEATASTGTGQQKPKLPSIIRAGLVAQYLDLVTPCTEAPEELHVAGIFTAVGCAIGRRAYINNPHPLYPNFYSLGKGPTSDSRKTTANRFAITAQRDVAKKLGVKTKPLFGAASVEGLAAAMKDGDSPEPFSVLLIEDEFKSLITKSQQKGVSNLVPRLTELYNTLPSFEVNTRNDRIVITNPFLAILSSTTEVWFLDAISTSDISGGFLNRWCLFDAGSECRDLIPFPRPVPKDDWSALVDSVADAISECAGEYELSADAREAYKDFYISFRRRTHEGLAREATSRMDSHALKFALVYAVLSKHKQIELGDIGRGIALAKYCGDVVAGLVANVGVSRIGSQEQKLLLLLSTGRMSTRDALRKLKCSADELNRISRSLQNIGLLDIKTEETAAGRRRVFLEKRD
jgi:hypothetical protein